MNVPIHTKFRQYFSQKSILWHAVMHSIVLSTASIVVLTTVSYFFTRSLIERYGWQHNTSQILASAAELSQLLLIVGFLVLTAAVLLSFLLAGRLTRPLLHMAQKIVGLSAGKLIYPRTIRTGDETELLDSTIYDLTTKLRMVYEKQEQTIEERTDELAQEYAKDRTILEALTFGLLVLNNEGAIVEVNPAANALLKQQPGSMLGKLATEVLAIEEHRKPLADSENPILESLRFHRESHISPERHITVTCADGTALPAKISATPLMEGQNAIGAIVLFQDVTTEREFDYMKTEFITLASHQLRTPLSSMRWYLELLKSDEKDFDVEQVKLMQEMERSSDRMLMIVNELMEASRLEQGGVKPVLKKLDVLAITKDVIANMDVLTKHKNVDCVTTLGSEPAMIETDPVLLGVVIQNILHNAVKYSPEGANVQVSVSQEKKNVCISIRDEGIGIPQPDQEHIFKKLFRARNVQSLDVTGSGLGLYSSKMIINKLKGNITFKSEEGKGTEFTVSLPL